jgi:hypothetical protein
MKGSKGSKGSKSPKHEYYNRIARKAIRYNVWEEKSKYLKKGVGDYNTWMVALTDDSISISTTLKKRWYVHEILDRPINQLYILGLNGMIYKSTESLRGGIYTSNGEPAQIVNDILFAQMVFLAFKTILNKDSSFTTSNLFNKGPVPNKINPTHIQKKVDNGQHYLTIYTITFSLGKNDVDPDADLYEVIVIVPNGEAGQSRAYQVSRNGILLCKDTFLSICFLTTLGLISYLEDFIASNYDTRVRQHICERVNFTDMLEIHETILKKEELFIRQEKKELKRLKNEKKFLSYFRKWMLLKYFKKEANKKKNLEPNFLAKKGIYSFTCDNDIRKAIGWLYLKPRIVFNKITGLWECHNPKLIYNRVTGTLHKQSFLARFR